MSLVLILQLSPFGWEEANYSLRARHLVEGIEPSFYWKAHRAPGLPFVLRLAMGTDIFVSGDMYGRNSLEIKFLQDAGMTALDAIETATANGPDTLGPQAPLSGQLKESYDADVIAIDFNPLKDNSDWGDPDRVTHVWQAGVSVKSPA